MTTDVCGRCHEPIEHMRSAWQVDRGTYRNPAGHETDWFHVGGEQVGRSPDFHLAAPVPRCPGCGSTNYRHDATDPWADHWRCGDCPYTYRMSLGD